MKTQRNIASRAPSQQSQRLSRVKLMNQNSREANESAGGNSDGTVFPFIEMRCEEYHNRDKKTKKFLRALFTQERSYWEEFRWEIIGFRGAGEFGISWQLFGGKMLYPVTHTFNTGVLQMNIDALRALIERRRSIRGYKTRALQGAYGRKGGPAKYWVSDKPTAFVFRNGMGRHVSGRFISAIAEQ